MVIRRTLYQNCNTLFPILYEAFLEVPLSCPICWYGGYRYRIDIIKSLYRPSVSRRSVVETRLKISVCFLSMLRARLSHFFNALRLPKRGSISVLRKGPVSVFCPPSLADWSLSLFPPLPMWKLSFGSWGLLGVVTSAVSPNTATAFYFPSS